MWRVDRAIMVLASAAIIGILMIVFGPRLAVPWSTIITNIGMGFLVAGVVGITVELYVREQMRRQMDRMLHDVGTDVFKAALGHEFPESVWEQVSTHLLLNPVIRKNVNVDYNLANLSGDSGEFVRVQTCFSYTVCNLNTVQEWSYPCVASLDRCLDSRFHDLRHTHATLMLWQGIHPKIVSERLGHSSIAITLDTYSHVMPGLQEAAAQRFEEGLQMGRSEVLVKTVG